MRCSIALLLLQLGLGQGAADSCFLIPEDGEQVALLQHTFALSTGREIKDSPNFVWVHPPKTGSSLINTIIKLPGLCDLPSDFEVTRERFGARFLDGFTPMCVERCPDFNTHTRGHHGLAKSGTRGAPHMVGMFRNPAHRVASAYQDMQGNYQNGGGNLFPSEWAQCESYGGWPNTSMPSLTEYVSLNRGCQVKMLTRPFDECPCSYSSPHPSFAEVEVAKQRLSEDFSFFGITEEWNLSMCLFHAMYQAECTPAQFDNTRPHTRSIDSSHLSDPWDDEFYKEVVRLFRQNLVHYNVSAETCQTCWRAGGVLEAN